MQSECGKMGTRITPNTDTFYAVHGGLILTGTYPERFIDWCMKIFIDETVVQKVADFIMLPHLSKLLLEINT